MWPCWVVVLLYAVVQGVVIADTVETTTEAPAPAQRWWETAILYQIYPRSFRDSDGDGVGDIKGMTQSLPYLKEIGVQAIWCNPILKSPFADFGYDIADFREIDPLFGTMEDYENFVKAAHDLDIKVLFDLVPNHTSDEHVWFQQSVQRVEPYDEYYVWRDGIIDGVTNKRRPPNNWKSNITGDAWEWNEQRQQYYLHQFVVKQPELNYSNPNVVKEMDDIIKFWLDKGVDGFRVDAVPFLWEDLTFPDEPVLPGTQGLTGAELDHIYTQNQPETYELCRHWAEVVFNYSQADGKERVLFIEAYASLDETIRYYGNGTQSLMSPFNFFFLTSADEGTRAPEMMAIALNWINKMPPGAAANWVIGNHDRRRIANTFGTEMVDAMNLLTGILPGMKGVYYGEDIGMTNAFIRFDQTVDPSGVARGPDTYLEASRDPARTPMQWDSTPSAGFSTNRTTWLPVNPNYWWLNVALQNKSTTSHLKVFRAMAKIREDPVMKMGQTQVLAPDDDTLVVTRKLDMDYYALILNLGSEVVDYTAQNFFEQCGLNDDLMVMVSSIQTGIRPGTKILKGGSLTLRPKSAVVLKRLLS